MPSSRRPRTRARAPLAGPGQARPQCRALLSDETTHCSVRAQGRARYCTVHGREYGQLTGAYKHASSRVDALEPGIRKASTVAELGTVADVDAAIALANRYLDALGEEIHGREMHHKRFFQEVDENHERWLKRRRGEQEDAVRLLERLWKRREEVGAVEAAARRIEEQRKAYEVQRRATTETRRRAIQVEEAQRRAAVETRRELGEDGWWADGEDTRRKAEQTRSVLGDRTNAATGTSSTGAGAVGYRVAERTPPGYWPAAGPSSRLPPPQLPVPQLHLQPPRYPSAPQSTGERRPLLQPASAGTPRPGTVLNSWLVDVENQARNAAQLRAHVHHRVRNEEVADSDSGWMTTIFCVVGFLVLCHLVVIGYLLQGSTGKWFV